MFTKKQMQDGRRLLAEILPEARKCVDEIDPKPVSALGRGALHYMCEANLDALVIHSPRTGGFIADLVLKDTPAGVANTVGTPVGNPHATLEEARDSAVYLVALALKAAQVQNNAPEDPVFFSFDAELPLVPELLSKLRQESSSGEDSTERSLERLNEITEDLFPDGYSFPELLTILEDVQRASKLLAVVHVAAVKGWHRYPPPEPRPPVVKH
jgi:hypothetical protein